ncbi:hypothetical protein ASG29_16170 [Sphingomonas sp. Leaf412]|uniref:hypothetical protein n=1 Tax=Sphingomonas sp. Leaf412 TaxID=1736370 RepID=UPI0006FB5716|nr:hypothetical protein [Sphingomonas sp. Leaf412]KQT31036.1 hypothetical protein ASG29_16170 [Sphingomonas sp. Leaf412]
MSDEQKMDDERGPSSAKRPFNPDGGEDEASTSHDGNDDHLHDDQKPITGTSSHGDNLSDDDPHKTEKLTKAGRPIDPDAGSD